MRNVLLLLFFSIGVVGAGCKTTGETPPPQSESAQPQIAEGITGTVTYIDLEGGFYGIMAENGARYFPINLGSEFKQDGLRVRFTMRERTDVMTTTMWGTTIEITSMERR